jgi:hypothetical protein
VIRREWFPTASRAFRCQCAKPPGPYGDGEQHDCEATATAEDRLCDACRSGCTVLWLTTADLKARKAFPFHAEWPRIARDENYLLDLIKGEP